MVRIQIELPEEKVQALEKLMKEVGIKTKKDLLNNALTFLEWAIQEVREGNSIAAVNEKENKIKEIVMPIFKSIKNL